MLFNSEIYFLFLPLVVIGFFAMPTRWRGFWMLAASYYFYSCWRVNYLVLILASTLIDYLCGLGMGRFSQPARRKALLGISLAANLGLLFVFKYYNFFRDTLLDVGLLGDLPHSDLLLPVGISFYTFQTLSYTIDVYRRKMEPQRRLDRFALYVAFFPQLVAGPIERAQRLIPQIERIESVRWDSARARDGAALILWGLFKKSVIADRLALYVNAVYADVPGAGGLSLLLATYFFAFQIYCDFSGYSDMAIGTARIFGINLMENFRQPYLAKNMQEFWRRWHISLSSWFRDYVFIPLGGSRLGAVRTAANMIAVFAVSGLWHGANWTFVVWGLYHGLLTLASRFTLKKRDRFIQRLKVPPTLVNLFRIVATFHLAVAGWVFFRAQSISDAWLVFAGLFSNPSGFSALPPTFGTFQLAVALGAIAFLMGVQILQTRKPGWNHFADSGRWVRFGWYYLLLFGILTLGVFEEDAFIYFQF